MDFPTQILASLFVTLMFAGFPNQSPLLTMINLTVFNLAEQWDKYLKQHALGPHSVDVPQ